MTTIAQNFTDVIVNIFNPTMFMEPTIVEIGIACGLVATCLYFMCESYKMATQGLIIYSLFIIIIGIFAFSVDEFTIYLITYIVTMFVSISFMILLLLSLALIISRIKKFKN